MCTQENFQAHSHSGASFLYPFWEICPSARGFSWALARFQRRVYTPLHHSGQNYKVARSCADEEYHCRRLRQGSCKRVVSMFRRPQHHHVRQGGSVYFRDLAGVVQNLENQACGIVATIAYHPQSNGLVEPFHRQLKNALKARTCCVKWVDHLPCVMLGIRAAPKEDSAI